MTRIFQRGAERWFLASALGFLVTVVLQKRHIFETSTTFLAGAFTEAGAVALYASDLVFLVLVLFWFLRRPRMVLPRGSSIILVLFTLWVIGRAPLTTFPLLGAYHAARTLQGMLLFLIVLDLLRRGPARRALLWTLVLVGVAESLLAGGQVLRGASFGLHALGEPVIHRDLPGVAKVDLASGGKLLRGYGTLPHPNVLGGVLVASIMATLGLLGASRENHSVLLPSVVLQYAGVLLTFSRSAVLAVVLTFIAFYFIRYTKILKSQVWAIALFPVILLSLLAFPPIREGFFSRVVPPPSDQFIEGRSLLFGHAFSIVKGAPFFGVGPGGFVPELLKRVPVGTSWEPWRYEYPHMVPLVILAELGSVGLLLFLFLVVSLVAHGGTLRGTPWTVIVGFTPLLLLDHYLWTLNPGRALLWGGLAVLLSSKMLHTPSDMSAPSVVRRSG